MQIKIASLLGEQDNKRERQSLPQEMDFFNQIYHLTNRQFTVMEIAGELRLPARLGLGLTANQSFDGKIRLSFGLS